MFEKKFAKTLFKGKKNRKVSKKLTREYCALYILRLNKVINNVIERDCREDIFLIFENIYEYQLNIIRTDFIY